MKPNYFLFITLTVVILFRGSIINAINNVGSLIIKNNNNIEITLLKNRINELDDNYKKLLTFKNNINIKENYVITNVYNNNYNFDKLIINGKYLKNDEVINEYGLVGLIDNANEKYSEIKFIYDCNIAVKINDSKGKIVDKDKDNNLIIRELSNYNNININDKVYSVNDTYIGKVIEINKMNFDTSVVVKTIDLKNTYYVAVITRMSWY